LDYNDPLAAHKEWIKSETLLNLFAIKKKSRYICTSYLKK